MTVWPHAVHEDWPAKNCYTFNLSKT